MLGRLIRDFASSVFARRPDAPAMADRAQTKLAAGHVGAARSLAQRALAADPACVAALRVIAYCDAHGRQWPQAAAALRRALEIEGGNAEVMVELGRVMRALGDAAGAAALARRALHLAPGSVPAGRLLAEIAMPGEHYLRLLERIQAHLRPATYVEIGIFTGESLRLVGPGTDAIGIDPEPKITAPLPANARVFAETSDAFFARDGLRAAAGERRVDLAFIDGMHHFEFALRDFVNLERRCGRNSTILFHDVFPVDASVAERERRTTFWTGDVWRALFALKKYRPDLEICTLSCPPSGLGMVRRLDPGSTVLDGRLDAIVAEFLALPLPAEESGLRERLNVVSSEWCEVAARLDRRYD